jgi:hypothetical protein
MSGGASERVKGRRSGRESSRCAGQGEYEYAVVDATAAVALPMPAFLHDRRTPAALLRIRELRGIGYPPPPFAVLELSEKVVRTLSEAREPVKSAFSSFLGLLLSTCRETDPSPRVKCLRRGFF